MPPPQPSLTPDLVCLVLSHTAASPLHAVCPVTCARASCVARSWEAGAALALALPRRHVAFGHSQYAKSADDVFSKRITDAALLRACSLSLPLGFLSLKLEELPLITAAGLLAVLALPHPALRFVGAATPLWEADEPQPLSISHCKGLEWVPFMRGLLGYDSLDVAVDSLVTGADDGDWAMDVSLLDKCCLAACAMGVFCHAWDATGDGEARTEATLSFAYAASAAGQSGNAAARAACYGAVWTLQPGLYVSAERLFAWFMSESQANFGSPDTLVELMSCLAELWGSTDDVLTEYAFDAGVPARLLALHTAHPRHIGLQEAVFDALMQMFETYEEEGGMEGPREQSGARPSRLVLLYWTRLSDEAADAGAMDESLALWAQATTALANLAVGHAKQPCWDQGRAARLALASLQAIPLVCAGRAE